MSRGYGLKPDRCTCFEFGYCYKSLSCRSKAAKDSGRFELVRENKSERKRIRGREILAWRADGSHERGAIPLGRIPADFMYLIDYLPYED